MTQKYTPFPDIVEEVQRLCMEKASGSFFIATESNRSAHLMLENGEIVFVYYYNKQGTEALEMMSSISAGRYSFQQGLVSAQRSPLPPTDEILQTLNGLALEIRAKQPAEELQSAAAQRLSSEQKRIFENCLAEYIGPMAAIICEDHLHSSADLESATAALMAEIPSIEQADKFRAEVMQRLG